MFFVVLFLGAALANTTDPPTHPTPFPVITPAPESNCAYGADDMGPFALDCLQALFLDKECSVAGLAYPTETNMETLFNKQVYNEMKWSKVDEEMQKIHDEKDNDTASMERCRGVATPAPVDEPTPDPTTLPPSPSPTVRTTTSAETPSPVYDADAIWKIMYENDGTEGSSTTTKDLAKAACEKAGYARQYDSTQYLIKMTASNGEVDYYTTEGEICEVLADPTSADNRLLWSDREDGPFQLVTVEGGVFTIADIKATTGPDGRIFPRWYSDTGAGGVASVSDTSLAELDGSAFKLSITSKRMYSDCREMVPPQGAKTEGLDQTVFSSRCKVPGPDQQQLNDQATICANTVGDQNRLLTAIANNMFATCDSVCVYDLDYSNDITVGVFWTYDTATNQRCWKQNTAWGSGTWNPCDTDLTIGEGSHQYPNDYAHTVMEKDMLCKPRCDYAQGWLLSGDTCYQVALTSAYASMAGADNFEKGLEYCKTKLTQDAFQGATVSYAGIRSKAENKMVEALCGPHDCYFGAINDLGKGTATWSNGAQVTYTNFKGSDQLAFADGGNGNALYMMNDVNNVEPEDLGKWNFRERNVNIGVVCSTPALTDDAESGRTVAVKCRDLLNAGDTQSTPLTDANTVDSTLNADNQKDDTMSYPNLVVANSGFLEADNPGTLVLEVEVPKTMYDVYVTFENSTNDAADYNWQWKDLPARLKTNHGEYWTISNDAEPTDMDSCRAKTLFTAKIPWTVFNLGGAGGVQRLQTYEDGNAADPADRVVDTEEAQPHNINTDPELFYQFGSVIRIEAMQPVQAVIKSNDNREEVEARVSRTADFDRAVTVRMPFILRFQKTITVSLDVNVISTKFNYKTVAAIIQSVQHSTQYFKPPYAKIDVQIRTKSQYPYRFQHNGDDTPGKVVGSQVDQEGTCTDDDTCVVTMFNGEWTDVNSALSNEMVNLHLDWLADDANCTFTNPDHMREGDICVQEWMLHIEPKNGVCYATGEYSIMFTATCFKGKDVCYLPKDENDADIEHVTFTFKIQTSKFCPEVADTVDLDGSLRVTGRNSFKPAADVQGDTDGSLYQQGETIYLIANTVSEKATIQTTEVIMVELRQTLTGLTQTGYNRVPYDANLDDITVWTKGGTVANGRLTIHDGDNVVNQVTLMTDDDVFMTGAAIDDGEGNTDQVFSETEAGFRILLHARAFPVNVDSFGQKTLVATLAVTYDDLGGTTRRRRLLSAVTDTRAASRFDVQSFRPRSMPNGLGESSSFAVEMTLESNINRNNVNLFVHSVKQAILSALNDADNHMVYDSQVAVDRILSRGISIWERTDTEKFNRRLEARGLQRVTVEITFAKLRMPNAMPLSQMVKEFDTQLKTPTSTLMTQPVFYGAVFHDVYRSEGSDYTPRIIEQDVKLTSSAIMAVPMLIIGMIAALM